ncbi:type II toxin-antitoxin system RelE/ParE family toxin [Anaerosporobacter sp.]|uniref:type II toxin-antitoxin system RelE/ParE family toxin n=1 Tax=Anaerosporobacter sp. TaxID=1872529 RepID=UPI00286F5BA1|nr:type II toxin-antitoxin system RelE/ParE family toxin [Anaerosporobacter sp.]
MTYRVEILPTAWEDLKRIEDWYIVQFSMETALKVSDAILDAIERLERFPDSGSLTPDEWLNQQGYRMIICEKHVAIHKLIHDVVYIYHIGDTRTDYTKLFY